LFLPALMCSAISLCCFDRGARGEIVGIGWSPVRGLDDGYGFGLFAFIEGNPLLDALT